MSRATSRTPGWMYTYHDTLIDDRTFVDFCRSVFCGNRHVCLERIDMTLLEKWCTLSVSKTIVIGRTEMYGRGGLMALGLVSSMQVFLQSINAKR